MYGTHAFYYSVDDRKLDEYDRMMLYMAMKS